MYPKNTWYVACTPDEIATKPLGRQICGKKSCSTAPERTKSPPSRTSARTAAHRCRWAMSRTATWCAATTAW